MTGHFPRFSISAVIIDPLGIAFRNSGISKSKGRNRSICRMVVIITSLGYSPCHAAANRTNLIGMCVTVYSCDRYRVCRFRCGREYNAVEALNIVFPLLRIYFRFMKKLIKYELAR